MTLASAAGKTDVTTDLDGGVVISGDQRIGPSFTLPDNEEYYFKNAAGEFVKRCTFGRSIPEHRRTTMVYSMLLYDLEFQYEDGQIWTGEIMHRAGRITWERTHVSNGRFSGFRVPSGVEAEVSVASYRAGYDGRGARWIGGEQDPAWPVTITLPRDDLPYGKILVDLTALPPDETVVISWFDIRSSRKLGIDFIGGAGGQEAAGGQIVVAGGGWAGRFSVSVMNRKQGWN